MLFKLLIEKLFHSGIDKKSYIKAQEKVRSDNNKHLRFVSILAFIYFLISYSLCFFVSGIRVKKVIYFIEVLILVLIKIIHLICKKNIEKIQHILILLVEVSLFATAISMGLIGSGDRLSVMLMVFYILVPLLFIDNPIKITLLVVVSNIVYLTLAHRIKDSNIFFIDLMNSITYSTLGLIIGYRLAKTRYERYLYEISVSRLADERYKISNTDEPTGLLNRRAYFEKTEKIKEKHPEKLTFIMFDLNGLKRTNDKYGHLAGDQIISGAAECLSGVFYKDEEIFRYGGDEFIVISFNNETIVKKQLEILDNEILVWNKNNHYTLSLSTGIAYYDSSSPLDFDKLLSEADQAMYESKKRYYEESGFERRLY